MAFFAWITPQRVPVVEPERHTEAPTGASLEPFTGTVPPLKSFTTPCGVHWPLTSTTAQSSPGNEEAAKVPWATRFAPVVRSPGRPQCPAVTKPPTTEKPTEQRPALLMKYASPPRTSNSGRGASSAVRTRTAPAGTPLASAKRRPAASAPGWATTTTELVGTSTYQPATSGVASRPAASRRVFTASSSATPRSTGFGTAPAAVTRAARAGSATATLSVAPSAPSQLPP
ncbi:hypothetical protein B0E53_03319 [Micromonospora sp. MH33]|nr:hypothetical protein B0E53_03319 [Micromonospora sp. MH33]